MASVEAFIRFVDVSGAVNYGAIKPTQLHQTASLKGIAVERLLGDPFKGFTPSGKTDAVEKVLCPLEAAPAIYGIGVNYRKHAVEANITVPKHPLVFTKPPDALAGPDEPIPIHPDCQQHTDYEGELTVIIGRDCKNATVQTALSYVLGYTVGNDVSARNFQNPVNSGHQHGYAKSFDKFAPIGPAVVLAKEIPDPSKVNFVTRVNGEERQRTSTGDMIWSVPEIIAHLSRGRTLRPGTVIMTGTPKGVGSHREPPIFLKDGDEVEVDMENIGVLRNKMAFEPVL